MNARAFLNDTSHTNARERDNRAAVMRCTCGRARPVRPGAAPPGLHAISIVPHATRNFPNPHIERWPACLCASTPRWPRLGLCPHEPAGLMRPHISRVHAPPTRTPKRPPPRPRSRLSRVLTVRAWPIPTARDHTHKRTHAHTHKGVPSRVVVVRASRRSRRAFARLPPRATPPFYLASE